MKAMLKSSNQNELFHYAPDRVVGPNKSMSGDCSDLSGDCSDLSGDCSGLSGDLDECEITHDERRAGIDIRTLVSA